VPAARRGIEAAVTERTKAGTDRLAGQPDRRRADREDLAALVALASGTTCT